jgi:hypothetical protein
MQQRQLRLGDILDDYCPRERRLTNHVIVAMVGADVKQTRCTTCDTEHEYKHAKVPRQRRKLDSPAALYAQVAASAPKRVTGAPSPASDIGADQPEEDQGDDAAAAHEAPHAPDGAEVPAAASAEGQDREAEGDGEDEDDNRGNNADDEGPVHRPLIRASLPREGQPPITRPIPEFTIRQPGGRPNRFRPRHQGGGRPFQGPSGNGPGGQRSAGPRHNAGGGRPSQGGLPSRLARHHGPGRKRQK